MTTPLFTIADCDRHDFEYAHRLLGASYEQSAVADDDRQCATIRALAAALREALANCGECNGTGWNLDDTSQICPLCKSGRELLAAVEGKP